MYQLPEGCFGADLCQVCESLLADADPLGLSADLDDLQTAALLATQSNINAKQLALMLIPADSPASSPAACTAWCGLSSPCPVDPEGCHVES